MTKSGKLLAFVSGLLFSVIGAAAADLSGSVTFRGKPVDGAVVTANLIGAKGPAEVSVTRTTPLGQSTLSQPSRE